MSDPNKDWLEAELENLRDMEAPPALLPKVMEKVRERAARTWSTRLAEARSELFRSFVLGISLVMMVLLVMVDPVPFFSRIPGASALFNLIPLLLGAAREALVQAKFFNFSVLAVLTPTIVLSYIFLVATASAIRHLANARK
jgi:hypothetical protein